MNTAPLLTVIKQASSDGQFQMHSRPDGQYRVDCLIERDSFPMGIFDFDLAQRVLRYATMKSAEARHAVRRLYLDADDEPMQRLVEAAKSYKFKTRKSFKVTLEIQLGLAGDAEDAEQLLRDKLNLIAAVKAINSIIVEEL